MAFQDSETSSARGRGRGLYVYIYMYIYICIHIDVYIFMYTYIIIYVKVFHPCATAVRVEDFRWTVLSITKLVSMKLNAQNSVLSNVKRKYLVIFTETNSVIYEAFHMRFARRLARGVVQGSGFGVEG